jgi:hypothetical protein
MFSFERHFPSAQFLHELGGNTSRRSLGSELDLNLFQRITVEDHVTYVISQLPGDETLRDRYRLLGSIKFEKHGNILSAESTLEDGVQQLSISDGRRRSPRLRALQEAGISYAPTVVEETTARKSAHPRAD